MCLVNRSELAEQAYGLRYTDAKAAIRLGLEAVERGRAGGDPGRIAHGLVAAGAARAWIGEGDAAAGDLASAMAIFETHEDPIGMARAITWQGMVARQGADYDRALAAFTRALAVFLAENHRPGEAEVKRMIGMVQALAGDFVAALEWFDECLAVAEELDDQHAAFLCRNDMGVALFELGDHDAARSHLSSALEYFRRTGAKSSQVHALNNLGRCFQAEGDHDRAAGYLRECIAMAGGNGERLPVARATLNLGRVEQSRGDTRAARQLFERAEELSRWLGERRTQIDALIGMGRADLAMGDVASAIAGLSRAREEAEASDMQRPIAEAHLALAEAHEAAGQLEAALRHYKHAHRVQDRFRQAGTALRMKYRDELAVLQRTREAMALQILKAQLQPHFLLNALHSVSALVRLDPATARTAIGQLGDLLRLALRQSSGQTATLRDEIEFLDAYVELELLRHRDAFRYEVMIEPEVMDAQVPHLLLQPLVENAIRHGLGPDEPARIEVRAWRVGDDRVGISVRDTGRGLKSDWSPADHGVGLRNTRARLSRLFGPDHHFSLGPAEDGGVVVAMELPTLSTG